MSNQKSGFDYIWDGDIKKAIEICYQEMDVDFCEQAKVSICNLNEYKVALRELYHRKREWLKREYLPHKIKPVLDFHKLGAIICRCIIGNKPITFDEGIAEYLFDIYQNKKITTEEKLRWQINNCYVNYRIAFLAAAGVAFDDLLCWSQENINALQNKKNGINEIEAEKLLILKAFKAKLLEHTKLFYYHKSAKHDDFVSSVIISLMKNDILMRDFDYLTFAANLFQWQEYTKLLFFTEVLNENNQQISYFKFANIFDLCDVVDLKKVSE